MKTIILVFLILLQTTNAVAEGVDFTKFVDPFIGTGGHGHTFPGATVPFGFVQLSPDTRLDDWDGSAGYHYSDSIIYGFSHTHLSGTGIPDYCDILLTPSVEGNGDRSFSHSNESATAGFYSVKMNNGITVDLTATKRVGFHRYSFPDFEFVDVFLDLGWRDKVLDSELKIVGTNRIEGFRRSSSWAKDQIVYFVAEFSEPFVSHAVAFNNEIMSRSGRLMEGKGTNIGVSLRFKNPVDKKVLVKVAISPVSVEGAGKNLAAELNHWDFEKVRIDARDAWNKELSKIEVSGGTDGQMTNFYTALYHTMIAPNVFQDVDGNYLGLDKKIHNISDNQDPKSENYTIFSLWDTFRAAHPLYTIIDQKRTVDFINTFIRQFEQGGRLPVWELAANETDTMIGYHAVSVIADAMAKDIKGFDYEKAYEAAKHSAELDHFGLKAYKKRGYISMEDDQESVSKTLEYAYNDFCIAQMARIMERRQVAGAPSDYQKYIKRAKNYKNLFHRKTGFMQPKQNGNWISEFAPNDVTFHFTEGNSWQYTFFVPHDISGLIGLFGGRENFSNKLDELFSTDSKLTGRDQPDITGLIGQYAHGNEPSHHIAYLYNYAGNPWKTQQTVRKILDEFYKPTPDGLIGNEDCGQMSAWFVLSALGFYQVNPSVPIYTFGTPIFKNAKIHLENGKTFEIRANQGTNSPVSAPYIQSARMNGKDHKKLFLNHQDLMNGGVLELWIADKPSNWFTEFPVSRIAEQFPTVPAIEGKRSFESETTVKITTPDANSKIYYTLDGSEPGEKSDRYRGPIKVRETVDIKAVSINARRKRSLTVEAKLTKMAHDWDIKLFAEYNRQYTGGGPKGLIDGIRGTTNFSSGEWQGYQVGDFLAVIDLKKATKITKVGGGFLQVARSWIWMPKRIEFEVSDDNIDFTRVADIETDVAPEVMTHTIKDFVTDISPVKARYVRVKAYNLGKIPAWHPGAGFDSFIFVDEIFIN